MIDSELLGKLKEYCDQLIDGSPSLPKTSKRVKQTNFSGSSEKSSEKETEFIQPRKGRIKKKGVEKCSKRVDDTLKISKLSGDEPHDANGIECRVEKTNVSKAKCQQTKDGFKVLSEIPPDDSDISDAFESDLSESEWLDNASKKLEPKNKNGIKNIEKLKTNILQTEDGFKMALDIPADDSDVSDAFVDELDEFKGLTQSQDSLKKGKNKKAKSKTSITEPAEPRSKYKINAEQAKLSSIKKPLLKIIEDFDLKDKIFQDQPPHLSKNRIDMPNKVCIPNSKLTLIDYSFRKNEKKEKVEPEVKKPENPSPKPKQNPKEAQATLKKMKHDLVKYRINGLPTVDRRKAKIELAIKLGAKPPKNQAVNYKCLIEMRKYSKDKAIAQRVKDRHFGMLEPKKKKARQRKLFTADNPTNVHPKMGMFKGGLLTLSKKDVQHILK